MIIYHVWFRYHVPFGDGLADVVICLYVLLDGRDWRTKFNGSIIVLFLFMRSPVSRSKRNVSSRRFALQSVARKHAPREACGAVPVRPSGGLIARPDAELPVRTAVDEDMLRQEFTMVMRRVRGERRLFAAKQNRRLLALLFLASSKGRLTKPAIDIEGVSGISTHTANSI